MAIIPGPVEVKRILDATEVVAGFTNRFFLTDKDGDPAALKLEYDTLLAEIILQLQFGAADNQMYLFDKAKTPLPGVIPQNLRTGHENITPVVVPVDGYVPFTDANAITISGAATINGISIGTDAKYGAEGFRDNTENVLLNGLDTGATRLTMLLEPGSVVSNAKAILPADAYPAMNEVRQIITGTGEDITVANLSNIDFEYRSGGGFMNWHVLGVRAAVAAPVVEILLSYTTDGASQTAPIKATFTGTAPKIIRGDGTIQDLVSGVIVDHPYAVAGTYNAIITTTTPELITQLELTGGSNKLSELKGSEILKLNKLTVLNIDDNALLSGIFDVTNHQSLVSFLAEAVGYSLILLDNNTNLATIAAKFLPNCTKISHNNTPELNSVTSTNSPLLNDSDFTTSKGVTIIDLQNNASLSNILGLQELTAPTSIKINTCALTGTFTLTGKTTLTLLQIQTNAISILNVSGCDLSGVGTNFIDGLSLEELDISNTNIPDISQFSVFVKKITIGGCTMDTINLTNAQFNEFVGLETVPFLDDIILNNNSMTGTQVDDVIIATDVSVVSFPRTGRVGVLTGNDPRTIASDTAYDALVLAGWTMV